MKNKKSMYILLPGVLLLWGFIVFKIFNHLGGGEDNPVFRDKQQKITEENSVPDTFSLNLDYKDPFLSRTISVRSKPRNRIKQVKKVQKKITWPTIEYTGRMVNQSTNRSRISITINGSEKIFSVGEMNEEVLLVRAYSDSIYVKYQGEKKTIYKK